MRRLASLTWGEPVPRKNGHHGESSKSVNTFVCIGEGPGLLQGVLVGTPDHDQSWIVLCGQRLSVVISMPALFPASMSLPSGNT